MLLQNLMRLRDRPCFLGYLDAMFLWNLIHLRDEPIEEPLSLLL